MRGDWIECKFDDVFFTTSGGTPSRRNENYYIGNIPWIKSGELKSNVITEAEEFISEEAVKNSSAKVFPAGTILLALYGATIGKIAILGIPAATNQAICGIFETPFVFSKYAYYYLVNKKSYLIKQGIGGAQPNISQTILKNLDFSLPPLPEQRAIVKKLESLFSSLDAGVADLKKAQQQLKIYRQAVLKKAFEGEFVTVRIGDVLNLSREKHKPDKPESLFYIGLEHIEKHTGRLTEKVGYEEINTVKNKFKKDDILYGKLRPNLNKVYLANESGVCSTDMLVFTPSEKVVPKFAMQIMLSRGFVNDMSNNTSGVNLPRVSTKYVENYLIPLPNIDEQKEIVKQIESRLSVCDSIEQNIAAGLEKAEALRQSILKKAFEGKLLTAQELAECKLADDYEPASVLLERIKAEQTEKKAKPSKKKPRHSVAKSQ